MDRYAGEFGNLPLSKANGICTDAKTGTKESKGVVIQVDARDAFSEHEAEGIRVDARDAFSEHEAKGIQVDARDAFVQHKAKGIQVDARDTFSQREAKGIQVDEIQPNFGLKEIKGERTKDSDRGKKITFPCCRFTIYQNRINDAVSHLESEKACFLYMENKAARLKKPRHLFCKLVQMTQRRVAARAKGCMCTFRTKCLRRYCECFGNGIYCSDNCKCGDTCHNDGKHEMEREEAIRHVKIETKMHGKNFNSTAFFFGNESFEDDDVNSCRCRNSHCIRKYCPCFAIGMPCNDTCVCEGCDNKQVAEKSRRSNRQEDLVKALV